MGAMDILQDMNTYVFVYMCIYMYVIICMGYGGGNNTNYAGAKIHLSLTHFFLALKLFRV